MKSEVFIITILAFFFLHCSTSMVWKKASEPFATAEDCEKQKNSEANWLRIGLFCYSKDKEGDRDEPKFKYPTGKLRCAGKLLELECANRPHGVSKKVDKLKNPSKEDLDGLKSFDDPFFKN